MINPAGAGSAALIASLAATVTPLRLGGALIEVDTGQPGAGAAAVTAVRTALGRLPAGCSCPGSVPVAGCRDAHPSCAPGHRRGRPGPAGPVLGCRPGLGGGG